jgi:hypothetical protein
MGRVGFSGFFCEKFKGISGSSVLSIRNALAMTASLGFVRCWLLEK